MPVERILLGRYWVIKKWVHIGRKRTMVATAISPSTTFSSPTATPAGAATTATPLTVPAYAPTSIIFAIVVIIITVTPPPSRTVITGTISPLPPLILFFTHFTFYKKTIDACTRKCFILHLHLAITLSARPTRFVTVSLSRWRNVIDSLKRAPLRIPVLPTRLI